MRHWRAPGRHSIATRLVIYILLCSSLITLLLTALQLFQLYNEGINGIDARIEQIRIGSLPTLEDNLWVVNHEDVRFQLADLLALPDIRYLAVTDERGKLIIEQGQPQSAHAVTAHIPLQHEHRGSSVALGTLQVTATKREVYEQLMDRALTILVTQAIKTFVVSSFIFIIFYMLVTRHLGDIATWAQSRDINGIDEPLRLTRDPHPHKRQDELDQVVTAFNELRENLANAYAKLLSSHQQLDDKVRERTEELETINRELDAFCYSISHDLRAPLRSVSGFSEILLEDHAQQLSDDALDYLVRIRKAGLKMSQLIDDMLRLSHLSQSHLKRQSLDISAMANNVIEDLRAQSNGRKVVVFIQAGLHAYGDRGLIEAVIENLLSNAWKYTSRTEDARIEMRSEQIDGKPVFMVLDNGVGFDMGHAENLFEPFRRLHRSDEFEGHGVGLATVDRIVRRHGGEVWAASEPGQGAQFYFTLPGRREDRPLPLS